MALVLAPEERQRLDELITICLAGEIKTTLLGEAVRKGDNATVLALLRLGMDKDGQGSRYTPLMEAAGYGHLPVLRTLVDAGADVHSRSHGGFTALDLAADDGHTAIVTALLRAKADKDAKTYTNETPLMRAAKGGHLPVVEALMAAGADLNVRETDAPYSTALDRAVAGGHNRVVKALIDQGVDVNAQGGHDFGGSALHLARGGEVVDLLVNAGANVNQETPEGVTPLFTAAARCNVEGVLTLLQHGAQVNLKEKEDGYTPLHNLCSCVQEACALNDEEGRGRGQQQAAASVSLLLRWGADETAFTNDGKTPADLLPSDPDDTIRLLLARAPADRAWYRRGWMVMLRSRASKEATRATQRHRSEDEGNAQLAAVVRQLVGLEEDGVFRTVLSFV